jgi:plastocyanin
LFAVCTHAGALVFEPATVTIKAGETVTWTNNAGFPHNIVFDEDAVPVSNRLQLAQLTSVQQITAQQQQPAAAASHAGCLRMDSQ